MKKSLLSSLHSNLCFMETSTTFYPVMAHHQAKEITSLKCGIWKIDCGLSDFHWLFINRLVCQIFLVNLKACLACWISSEAFITYIWNNYTSFTPFFLKNRQQLHFSCENIDIFLRFISVSLKFDEGVQNRDHCFQILKSTEFQNCWSKKGQ